MVAITLFKIIMFQVKINIKSLENLLQLILQLFLIPDEVQFFVVVEIQSTRINCLLLKI